MSVSYRVISGSGEEATVERTEVTETTVEAELARLQKERHHASRDASLYQARLDELQARITEIDTVIVALNARGGR